MHFGVRFYTTVIFNPTAVKYFSSSTVLTDMRLATSTLFTRLACLSACRNLIQTDGSGRMEMLFMCNNASPNTPRPAVNEALSSNHTTGEILLKVLCIIFWYFILYEGYVCVCVFFPFILDIKFVGRTSRGHTGGWSHRISHPPSFCGACLNFSREKDSAIPFLRRP